jgi:hypothetical protein
MEKASGPPCSSMCYNSRFRKQVCKYKLPVSSNDGMLKVATVVEQIIAELSETVRKRQNNGHYKNDT